MKNDNGKTPKTRTKYYCENCDFLTSNKKDFNRHILTRKHKKTQKVVKNNPIVDFTCHFCGKEYKYKSGLCRHNKKCKLNPKNFCGKNDNIIQKLPSERNEKKGATLFEKNKKIENEELDEDFGNISLKEILICQLKQREIEIKQQNETIELLKKSIDTNSKMIPKIGNNNNNTISINVFLNEQCKNAMNLTDFIDNLKVSLEDLQYSKNNGFIKGVTNIFTKQLQDLKPTERPIHCSDKKRLQFYVKDNNIWQKDTDNKKIDETIYNIKMKQTKTLTEWEKKNPTYTKDSRLMNEWQNILSTMTEDIDNPVKMKDKLKRNIAEHVKIKEALCQANDKQ